jgi:F-type H+-transporting ATPase subunit delta
VELEESIDSSLLGGAVASVGGLVFDGSLRTQLEQLRSSLTRGQ